MVYVFLATGFEEIEALTAVDLFRRADISVNLVSVTGEKSVKGSRGITVESDIIFEDGNYDECNMIVLPGGMPGTVNLCNHVELNKLLKGFNKLNKPIAAICAAPMVLAQAGILEGHKATIYRGMEEHLGNAEAVDEKVVVSGNIITSMGPGTAMDFALELIKFMEGEEKARQIGEELLYY